MSSALNISVAQQTHTGLKRQDNQDDMAWFSLPEGELFIVVDGMGGAVGGKTAASIAVSAIHQAFANANGAIPERLSYALFEANRQIHAKSKSDDQRYHGMGTTAVAMALGHDGLAYVAHVGDSRIYLFRNGQLKQITKDHTVLQRRIDNGLIAPEEAKNAKDGHILSQALGPKKGVQPEVSHKPIHLRHHDLVLMCTDGLSDTVPDHHIQSIVDQFSSIDQAGSDLIDAALQAGGEDNITVQIIAVAGERSNARPKASSPSVDRPEIKQSIFNSGTLKRKKCMFMGALWAICIVLAIAIGVAGGRFEAALERMQTKVAKVIKGVFESKAPAAKLPVPSAQEAHQQDATSPEASKSAEQNDEFKFHYAIAGDKLEELPVSMECRWNVSSRLMA